MLFGHAASELSTFRREQLIPTLKPEIHALCSSDTVSLFGEDLTKQVRDAKEAHRVSNTVGTSTNNNRGFRRDHSWQSKRENQNRGSNSRQGYHYHYQNSDNPAIMNSLEVIFLLLLILLFEAIFRIAAVIFRPNAFRNP